MNDVQDWVNELEPDARGRFVRDVRSVVTLFGMPPYLSRAIRQAALFPGTEADPGRDPARTAPAAVVSADLLLIAMDSLIQSIAIIPPATLASVRNVAATLADHQPTPDGWEGINIRECWGTLVRAIDFAGIVRSKEAIAPDFGGPVAGGECV